MSLCLFVDSEFFSVQVRFIQHSIAIWFYRNLSSDYGTTSLFDSSGVNLLLEKNRIRLINSTSLHQSAGIRPFRLTVQPQLPRTHP